MVQEEFNKIRIAFSKVREELDDLKNQISDVRYNKDNNFSQHITEVIQNDSESSNSNSSIVNIKREVHEIESKLKDEIEKMRTNGGIFRVQENIKNDVKKLVSQNEDHIYGEIDRVERNLTEKNDEFRKEFYTLVEEVASKVVSKNEILEFNNEILNKYENDKDEINKNISRKIDDGALKLREYVNNLLDKNGIREEIEKLKTNLRESEDSKEDILRKLEEDEKNNKLAFEERDLLIEKLKKELELSLVQKENIKKELDEHIKNNKNLLEKSQGYKIIEDKLNNLKTENDKLNKKLEEFNSSREIYEKQIDIEVKNSKEKDQKIKILSEDVSKLDLRQKDIINVLKIMKKVVDGYSLKIIGNVQSKVVHYSNSMFVKRIKPEKRVEFISLEEADKAGYKRSASTKKKLESADKIDNLYEKLNQLGLEDNSREEYSKQVLKERLEKEKSFEEALKKEEQEKQKRRIKREKELLIKRKIRVKKEKKELEKKKKLEQKKRKQEQQKKSKKVVKTKVKIVKKTINKK